jgi:hypothetical protein
MLNMLNEIEIGVEILETKNDRNWIEIINFD